MNRRQAIAHLVELEVARWGEGERKAAQDMYGRTSIGLALNRIAHYDVDSIDQELAAEAKRHFTDADRRVLSEGG
jgi:hypothetical protein